MIDVTVVVATCGTERWKRMGDEALYSVPEGAKMMRVHLPDGTVAEARNSGLAGVFTEYVVFLDADDDLDIDYFKDAHPTEDVTATSIDYNYGGHAMIPKVWAHENRRRKLHDGDCIASCLPDGNWVHIGAIMRTEAVKAVGGFKEYAVYEDWALFLAMFLNGATFGRHEPSVYHASVRESPGHRNRSIPSEERDKVHSQIINDLYT